MSLEGLEPYWKVCNHQELSNFDDTDSSPRQRNPSSITPPGKDKNPFQSTEHLSIRTVLTFQPHSKKSQEKPSSVSLVSADLWCVCAVKTLCFLGGSGV